MQTTPSMIERAAQELEARFKGSKVQDAGRLIDGRIAIALWKRNEKVSEKQNGTDATATSQPQSSSAKRLLVCMDVFNSPPLITVESGELPIATEPGFVRSVVTTLRGTTLLTVRARENDRVLRLDFGTRSRFGVATTQALIIELVPRFGNAVLVKDLSEVGTASDSEHQDASHAFRGGTIVAALREFSLAENGTRAIEIGRHYEPPPQRSTSNTENSSCHSERSTQKVCEVEEQADALATFAQWSDQIREQKEKKTGNHLRNALAKTLNHAEQRITKELAAIAEKREKAAKREELRAEGERIFATLYERTDMEKEEAKERAAKLFAQYRKLGASLPHLDEREKSLCEQLDGVINLKWELERTENADLADVEQAVAQTFVLSSRTKWHSHAVEGPSRRRAIERVPGRRKRKPLEFYTESGSRVLVGRTPIENADLTFRMAQPDDLWFHVQGQPGAHVILHLDDRSEPSDEDVTFAAQLAAQHSKARTSAKVAVDYTYRKHVRKRPNAAPGLVFYTHASTKIVEPL